MGYCSVMWIPSWARKFGTFVGHAGRAYSFFRAVQWLFSLGVTSIVTSWIAHVSEAFSTMPHEMRLVFFAGIGFLILATLLIAIQWVTYRFKPAWLLAGPPPTNPSPLEQQTAENETLRSENSRLRGRLENAEAAVYNREVLLIPCHQREKYGQELPSFTPLEPEANKQMLSGAHELKPSLRDTLAGAGAVWDYLAAQIRFHKGDREWDLFVWRLDRVENAERRYLEQVANALERVLENREEDPRPFLAGTYFRYRQWRDEMARVAAMFGGSGSLAFTVGSIQWMAAERRFLEELRKKLARPELEAVGKVISAYDEANGAMEDLSK